MDKKRQRQRTSRQDTLTSSSCGVQTGSVSESVNSSGSPTAPPSPIVDVFKRSACILLSLALREHCSRRGGKFKGSVESTKVVSKQQCGGGGGGCGGGSRERNSNQYGNACQTRNNNYVNNINPQPRSHRRHCRCSRSSFISHR